MEAVKSTVFYKVTLGLMTLFTSLYLLNQLQPLLQIHLIDVNLPLQIGMGLSIILMVWLLRRYRTLHQAKTLLANQFKQEIRALKRQHETEKKRLSVVLDSGRLAYWEWDIKNNQAYFSALWQSMIGFDTQDFPQDLHAWQSRIHPLDQDTVQKQLLQILGGKLQTYENTHRLLNQAGDYIWVYDRGQVITNSAGEIQKLSCVRLDVTRQKQTEEELTLDKILLEHTQEAIVISDESLRIVRTNPAFHTLFGFDESATDTLTLQALFEQLQDAPGEDILHHLRDHASWRGELNLHHAQGVLLRSTLVDVQKIRHQSTQTTHYAVVCTDITKLKQTENELRYLANTDMVTGLPNRNHFYEVLNRTFQQCRQAGQKFTVMYLDLDNFKTVNDTLGHDIGDRLLKSVSQVISEQLAADTLFARVGGDEFVILCRAYTTPEQLSVVGETLNQLISQPFHIGEHEVKVGSSIGMAIYPQHGQDQDALLKHADEAMYKAKKAGKGRYQIYQTSETA